MILVGVLGQMVYLIQAYKIYTTHSAHDLSIYAFLFGLFAASSWFVYGVLHKSPALIISNMVAIWGAIAVISGIIIYN